MLKLIYISLVLFLRPSCFHPYTCKHFLFCEHKTNPFCQIVQIVRGQLKIMETVGEILDALKLSVKLLFVENCVTASGVVLLNEIFQLLPVSWNQDPVKVSAFSLIT